MTRLVQHATVQSFGGTPIQISLPALPKAGNSIVVVATANQTGACTATDNQTGNTYTSIVLGTVGTGVSGVAQVLWCHSITAPTGTFTVTVSGTNLGDITVMEVEGLIAVDQSNGTSSSQTSVTTLTITNGSPNAGQTDFVVCGVWFGYSSAAIGLQTPAGYTSLDLDDPNPVGNPVSIAYKIANSPETSSATWNWTTTKNGVPAVIVSFKGSANFVSSGTAKNSATASMTTQIQVASAGRSVNTAQGFPGLLLYAGGANVSTGTSDLSTAIPVGSDGRAVSNASATLTNWASVVLGAPLYTGRGSIVGPHTDWSNGAPAVGDTVYYDPTNITVLSDGEIVASATDFKAEVMWTPSPGTLSTMSVLVTSGFASWSQNSSLGTASLTTAIKLVSGSRRVSTGRARFSVAAAFHSGGRSVSTGLSGIATEIRLVSAGKSRSAGAASMLTALPLSSHARARSTGIATMTSSIALSSRGSSVVLTSAAPFTGIALKSRGASVSTGTGTQRQKVQFTSAGRSVSIGSASLLTHLPLASRGASVSTSVGFVQFGAAFVSRGSSRSTGLAAVSTGIALVSGSRRVFTGELLQLFPARFGYAVVTPLSQSGAQAAEQAYVAGSTVYVEVAYFDSNGVPFVPNVVTYNVTDVVSGVSLVNSTQVIPAESEIITIKGAQNYMVNLTRASEQHTIVVAVTDGFGNTGYGQATFDVVRPPGT